MDVRWDSVAQKQAERLEEYLGCPCTWIPSMTEDRPILEAYREARKRGEREGFWPLLISMWNSRWFLDFAVYRRQSREELLSAPLPDGREVVRRRLRDWRAEITSEDPSLNWREDVLGKVEGGKPRTRLSGFWDCRHVETAPLVLAEIPAKNPWEVFAWLPFGGWNECPQDLEHMAVAKYWFEKYGAVPALAAHGVAEYVLPAPIPRERAMEAALEHYGYCADIVDQSFETVGALADGLPQSTVWYFWWD